MAISASQRLSLLENTGWRTAWQDNILNTLDDDNVRRHINEIILDEVTPYVPLGGNNFEQEMVDPDPHPGQLREWVSITPNEIEWLAPYARYQYYGKVYGPNYWRPITRGADGGWDKDGPHWFRSPKDVKKKPTGKTLTYYTPGTGAFWYKLLRQSGEGTLNRRISQYLVQAIKRRSK